MTKEDIETILRVELMAEMKGMGQVMDLMNDCVFFCEADQKNYVNGDKLMGLVRTPSIVTGPVILCTIEELRDVWDASGYYGDYPTLNASFEEYLKGKGITI